MGITLGTVSSVGVGCHSFNTCMNISSSTHLRIIISTLQGKLKSLVTTGISFIFLTCHVTTNTPENVTTNVDW